MRRFVRTEASGGIALVAATVVALIWANSPWAESYTRFWHAAVNLQVGFVGIEEDLRHLVNDGLMTLFFLVVAMEIKRELVTGDLRNPRVAALPAIAALGGMVVPALVYVAFNDGGVGSHGWGIPMATDIAFALGVLVLLGRRVPPALKLFLLSLAVIDDVGAIVVIAVFYTGRLDVGALALALGTVGGVVVLRRLRVYWLPAYVGLGVVCWFATYHSGIHATIAGVAFGLLTPARPLAPAEVARRWTLDMGDEPSAAELRQLRLIANETVSPAERLENLLAPVTSFVIVPIFALANAGIEISAGALEGAAAARVALGVGVGLVLGKLVGVFAASWLAVRSGLAALPRDASWRDMAGVAGLAGIGFTVSIFITGLAFDDPALEEAAKLAVLAASLCASAVGALIFLTGGRRRAAASEPA
ncbi:MAG TPA: Na+/H+ antiporter NhaA [Acidimicrobiales bacterium]|nr:Na+/H+ antiporter NhaA [Acidimicrobiales bacterium]